MDGLDRLKRKIKDIDKLPPRFHQIYVNSHSYSYRFPVYKYKNQTLITCILTADDETQELYIEVINNDYTIYPPYYNPYSYRNNQLVGIIEKKIEIELGKLKKEGVI